MGGSGWSRVQSTICSRPGTLPGHAVVHQRGSMAPVITAVDHIGVRVRDRARSRAFYGSLGFGVVYEDADSPVIILRNAAGVEINLVVNAASGADVNVLMDVP